MKERHHASITDPRRVGELMRAIDGYCGSFVTKCALRLAPLVFVRPGELRKAEWVEFDLDGAEWRIPAARMKARERHIVPLAKQAVAILQDLHGIGVGTQYWVRIGAPGRRIAGSRTACRETRGRRPLRQSDLGYRLRRQTGAARTPAD